METWLIKVVRNDDASKVEFILNNPKVEEMNQKEGLKEIYFYTNPPNSSLAEGNLQKKVNIVRIRAPGTLFWTGVVFFTPMIPKHNMKVILML